MTIALTPEQRRWLEAAVAEGRFASVEEAVEAALTGLMTTDAEDDDWIKPHLDASRAAVERGEGVSLDDLDKHLAHRRKHSSNG